MLTEFFKMATSSTGSFPKPVLSTGMCQFYEFPSQMILSISMGDLILYYKWLAQPGLELAKSVLFQF